MRTVTFYKENGHFDVVMTGVDQIIEARQEAEGLPYLEGSFSGDEFYCLNDEAVPRPEMGVKFSKMELKADGIDEIIIDDMPLGCQIDIISGIDRMTFWPDDQKETFTTSFVGDIYFRFELFPFKPFEAIIHGY